MPEVLPYAPSTIREILEFKTDVRRHPAGEFRDSLRFATQKLVLEFRLLPAVAEEALDLLRTNYSGEWQVPLWHDVSFLTGTYGSSTTYFDVDTDADYVAGGSAIIWSSKDAYEIEEVVSVDSSPVGITTTATTLSQTNPKVAPVGTFFLTQVSQTRTYAFETISVELLRTDGRDLSNLTWDTVSGIPQISDASVVVSPLDGAVLQAMDLIDNDFGNYAYVTEENFARHRAMVSFAENTKAARWALKQNLYWLRGRDQPFYLNSFRGTGFEDLHRLDADRIELEHRVLGQGEFLTTCRVPTIEVLA